MSSQCRHTCAPLPTQTVHLACLWLCWESSPLEVLKMQTDTFQRHHVASAGPGCAAVWFSSRPAFSVFAMHSTAAITAATQQKQQPPNTAAVD